ncbi:MAG: serine protein kinase RIO [Actinomycetota bacterium]
MNDENEIRALAAADDDEEWDSAQQRDGAEFESLYATGIITEVLGALKSGKEATVYVCRAERARAGADLVAAKVYRARTKRDFRNAAVYDDGRQFLEDRVRRAVKTKTRFGREAEAGRWTYREWERLTQLFAAGVAVPEPIGVSDGVIVMAYLGDEDRAAPRLRDVALPKDQAERAFRWLLYDIELMLGANVVHADLSPYNILWWDGKATIIDLPQAVDPRFNRSARMLLERDVANVCTYFSRMSVNADPRRIANDLWRRFLRAEL